MIERIRHIEGLLQAELPRGEFALVHSAWLSLIGMRENGDLDVVISSALRRERFSSEDPERHFGLPGRHEWRIRIQPASSDYAKLFGVRDLDDVIYNHCFEFDGVRFVEPRFYFAIKQRRLETNRRRWKAIAWWLRALAFASKGRRKLMAKIGKDEKDLVEIQRFLERGEHRRPEFAHVPESAWDAREAASVGNRERADA